MTLPQGFRLWSATEDMKTEFDRLCYLFACLEEAPRDDAFFAHAVDDVQRSRKEHEGVRDRPMTLKRIEKTMRDFPTVSLENVVRIIHALGYDFDVATLEAPVPRAPSRRAAAKRTRHAATRIQRRKA